jgi:hypothetical protein
MRNTTCIPQSPRVVKMVPFTGTSSELIERAPPQDDGEAGKRFMDRLADLINAPSIHPLLDAQASKHARALNATAPDSIVCVQGCGV